MAMARVPSDGVPGEDVLGAVEGEERSLERGYGVLSDGLRRPALAAVDRADRPRLAHQEDLVLAHGENLAGDVRGEIAGEIDRERCDLAGRHGLHLGNARLLLRRVGRDRADEPAPGE